MNLFILDDDLDRCAEAHVDDHVGKMQLEAVQMMATTLWVDREFGFVPRALNGEELAHLRAVAAAEPDINERKFVRYLPSHHNHPCSIWMRSSFDNWVWTFCYVNALNAETQWRGNNSHASCAEANRMPLPNHLPHEGLTAFAQAMPDDCKRDDAVDAYRYYYITHKAHLASWKRRGPPPWWEGTPYENYEASCKRDEEILGRDFR